MCGRPRVQKRQPNQNRRFQQRRDRPTEHSVSQNKQKPTSAAKREAEQKTGKKQPADEGMKPWCRTKFATLLGPMLLLL